MKNILVTGGTGYIGSHTVVELANADYRPVIVDDFSNSQIEVLEGIQKLAGQDIKFYKGHYQDKKLLTEILSKEKIDGVIHFAAYKSVAKSVTNPLKYFRNNVAGLLDLLEVLEEFSIPSLIFSSSCAVYGEPANLPLTEAEPFKTASSPYGSTKQMGETMIKQTTNASKTMRTLSLRYFNPIGAHPSGLIGELPLGVPENLVPFITQSAAGIRGSLTVFGDNYPTPDGTCIRDYIHVADVARAHVKALDYSFRKKAGFYDALNIGTGKGTSTLGLIKAFEKISGKKIAYKIGPRRLGDINSIYASADKAKKILRWQPELNLADALADAWRWQQNLARS